MATPEFRMTPRAQATCANCPLASGPGVLRQVTTEVRGQEIDVLFISDAPGAYENEIGRPVASKIAQILRRLVVELLGQDANVAYSTAVRCRPCVKDDTSKERKPTGAEMAACRPNLLADIDRIKPKQIVICGDVAAKGIARRSNGDPVDPKAPITALRGQDFIVTTPAGLIVPATVTYGYSFVYRTPEVAQVFRDDVIKAVLRAQGKVPDYSQRGKVTVLDTVAKLRKFQTKLASLTQDDVVVIDYETDSNTRINNPILCIGFAYGPDRGFVIPFQHPESPWSGEEFKEITGICAEILGDPAPPYSALVAHNFSFEQHITRDTFGFRLKLPTEDTLLRAHAINPDKTKAAKKKDDDVENKSKGKKTAEDGPFTLKTLVKEWLGFYHYDDPDIAPIVELRNQGKLAQAPFKGLADYNGMDCYTTYRLYRYEEIKAGIDDYDKLLVNLGKNLHHAATTVLVEMERNGIRIDKEYVRDLIDDDAKIASRMREIEAEFYALDSVKEANRLLTQEKFGTGGGLWGNKRESWLFSLNRPESKRALYFDVLQLVPAAISRKTQLPSVGKALFDQYAGIQEIDLFAEWSVLAKLQGTYLLGPNGVYSCLQNDPDARDGRVRTHFRAGGTITGRISATKPNVLNVPKKGEDGKKNASASLIKKMYICDPGNVMIISDYSQAEVRWLAELTQDPDLLGAFQKVWDIRAECLKNPTKEAIAKLSEEGDFHKHTASMIFGVPVSAVTKTQRSSSKSIMFGLVYGMTIDGLANRLKVTKKEAEKFIEKFFQRFPKAKAALDAMEVRGFQRGYIESPTGRRKRTSSGLVIGPDLNNLQYEARHLKSFKAHEDRVARNMPIQGIASDMNLLACYAILRYKEKHGLDWRLINSVYDSIMLETPFAQARHCIETVQKIMESPKLFKPFGFAPTVRFFAEVSVGMNWADQLDVTSGKEVWKVKCKSCGKTREESSKPTDPRCWECGEKKVSRKLEQGTIDMVLNSLDSTYHLS